MAYDGMWVVIVMRKKPGLGGVYERLGSVEEMCDSGNLSTFQVDWGRSITGAGGAGGYHGSCDTS